MINGTKMLDEVQASLPPAIWERRVADARQEAAVFDAALERVGPGVTRARALMDAFPGQPLRTLNYRLARYEAGGWEGLISRRAPPKPPEVVTPEVLQMVRGMLTIDPELRSSALCAALARAGIVVAESTLREHLRAAGLSHAPGRPRGTATGTAATVAEPLPLAGAELWKAVDHEIGAVQRLTAGIAAHLAELPAPEGEVVDDRGHRDDHGRFQASYNEASERTSPELGAKFETVSRHRAEKDLPAMRIANSSFDCLHLKNLALTLLPVVVDTPRWSVLQHWQGDHLGTLVGYAYEPATLDKYARELKLAAASCASRDAVTTFWVQHEGWVLDESTGAALLYVDATTKELWTHHFTRCAKVSKNGRVMPAISTLYLNTGAGTPVVYAEFSGHASVPREVSELIDRYEAAAGEGTARRVVVLDRESHAAWLFKEFDAAARSYIVPLRRNVVGHQARFEDVGPAVPYGESGDTVRDGWLWLNDSRPGEAAVRVRVVGRQRRRTENISWYATNVPAAEFTANDVIRLYFDRWPLQEHIFRDGNGRVGLDTHHGYGKLQVTDVAIVDQVEKLTGRIQRMERERQEVEALVDEAGELAEDQRGAIREIEADVVEASAALAAQVEAGQANTPTFRKEYRTHRILQEWLPKAHRRLSGHEQDERVAKAKLDALDAGLARAAEARRKLESRRKIFTVDTELDEIMTAFKLTFMNVCRVLMREVLGEAMELETLIRGILTLPGERVRTASREIIRIYRQPRDPRSMTAVERACERLNAKGLVREGRTLQYELVDRPK